MHSCKAARVHFSQGHEYMIEGGSHQTTLSDSVVIECQQGSSVWLQSDADACYVYGDDARYLFSTFGGFILQQV